LAAVAWAQGQRGRRRRRARGVLRSERMGRHGRGAGDGRGDDDRDGWEDGKRHGLGSRRGFAGFRRVRWGRELDEPNAEVAWGQPLPGFLGASAREARARPARGGPRRLRAGPTGRGGGALAWLARSLGLAIGGLAWGTPAGEMVGHGRGETGAGGAETGVLGGFIWFGMRGIGGIWVLGEWVVNGGLGRRVGEAGWGRAVARGSTPRDAAAGAVRKCLSGKVGSSSWKVIRGQVENGFTR